MEIAAWKFYCVVHACMLACSKLLCMTSSDGKTRSPRLCVEVFGRATHQQNMMAAIFSLAALSLRPFHSSNYNTARFGRFAAATLDAMAMTVVAPN